MTGFDIGEKGENIDRFLAQLRRLAALAVTEAHGRVPRVWEPGRLELIGREIIPAVATF